MTRKIAVFSDGTGNSSGKANKTNVWRLFQALDQTGSDQIARYDDGVGTSSNRYLAAFGGAFGWGLKRNVLDLYKFICRNYSHGDAIYGFGFSRGAFTIRVLVGLIAREGLVTFSSEAELERHAASAYRNYRSKSFPAGWKLLVALARLLRNGVLRFRDWLMGYPTYSRVSALTAAQNRKEVAIRFLGLWDTVEAYGVPIVGLKRGIDRFLWPMVFGDMKLTSKVERACHALSLDDERTTFHPLLWDDQEEARTRSAGRVSQVWFAGVHSNIGGGYPEDQLSLVSLAWIMGEAQKNGLRLNRDVVQSVQAIQSPFGKLYDSRAGLSSYYRYAPRHMDLRTDPQGIRILPVIHRSVVMRMTGGSDGYAPFTLPHEFWILDKDDNLVPLGLNYKEMQLDASKSSRMTLDSQDSDVTRAIEKLARPDEQAMHLVWDTVFWRRCLYVLTVSLSALLVIYPWVANGLSRALSRLPLLSTVDSATRRPIASIVEAVSGLIPSYAAPWKEALSEHPIVFLSIVSAVLATLSGSRILEARMKDRARLAWNRDFRKDYNAWFEQSRRGWRHILWMLFALGAAGSLAASFIGPSTRPIFGSVAIAALLVLSLRTLGYVKRPKHESRTKIRSTFALSLARSLRKNPLLILLFKALADHVVPAATALLLVAVGLLLLNRVAFDVVSAAGGFCDDADMTAPLKEVTSEKVDASTEFATESMCWRSGLVLMEGQRYEITLSTKGDWFDREFHTDLVGLPTHGLRHGSAFLLKRWWSEYWFRPIARIGEIGNDEYVLKPLEEVEARERPACLPSKEVVDRMRVVDKLNATEAENVMRCDPIPPERQVLRAEITARTGGELYLYVNDAVLALPGVSNYFLRNNSGTATVSVTPIIGSTADASTYADGGS